MKAEVIDIDLGNGKKLFFETGKIARQASGAVLARSGDTVVFSSACSASLTEETDFLPFRVDYQERFSAAGKTSGGFLKREGRPSEREVLVSRLIDRSLRPTLPERLMRDVQILSYIWSYDGKNSPDPLAICASSAALAISSVPILNPVAGVRVGYIDGKFVINPDVQQLPSSTLDLMLSGTESAILMIEGHCHFLDEEQILDAIAFGHESLSLICRQLSTWQQVVGKAKEKDAISPLPQAVLDSVQQKTNGKLFDPLSLSDKKLQEAALKEIEDSLVQELSLEGAPDFSSFNVRYAFKKIKSDFMRKMILESNRRADGRNVTEIRNITIEPSILPRTHGSCLFTRGETQSLAVCTLGGDSMGQRYEDLNGEGISRFYLHYFFPPFSVGEVGRVGSPGRREVGHGKLAERALSHILPDFSSFPYSIRLESNITESNGSSSMASVCGGCLALMDAGVPITTPVSGIAMGLILEGDRSVILSDISGIEDHLGDMDFKVAGSEDGIVAFQMDIKVEGITKEIMRKALEQARTGRTTILHSMKSAVPTFREEMSIYAPRIETMRIKPNKIATVIGPGGRQIRHIIETTGVQIDINDSGLVSIAAQTPEAMAKAKAIIEELTCEVEVGKVYNGRVTSVVPFGAFVEVLPGKEGLCHISELDFKRVENVSDIVKEGDIIKVKLLSINEKGQLKLSHKAVLLSEQATK
ncbi:polyribonucleotide nucleotidyltransferase [Chlamydiifrater volucris]|uniref:polyribonucleotide nucleotidyltransferase n=1 Tax=Chlamydiifrater volucris TaxID=2681470 RepID=UPI001BCDCEC7|nr:polyribonucleotide nucleotidyltransferase [Chlamydiifrater volucris]